MNSYWLVGELKLFFKPLYWLTATGLKQRVDLGVESILSLMAHTCSSMSSACHWYISLYLWLIVRARYLDCKKAANCDSKCWFTKRVSSYYSRYLRLIYHCFGHAPITLIFGEIGLSKCNIFIQFIHWLVSWDVKVLWNGLSTTNRESHIVIHIYFVCISFIAVFQLV